MRSKNSSGSDEPQAINISQCKEFTYIYICVCVCVCVCVCILSKYIESIKYIGKVTMTVVILFCCID